MNLKKLLVLFNILFMTSFIGYSNIKIDAYNSNLDIRGITLKISLIQTAYEIYNVNILNPSIYTEDLYKEFGKDSYIHYKWLKNTYKNMDQKMIKSLENIFSSKDQSEYINSIIELDDNSDLNTIISNIINNKSLNLTSSLKKDIEIFFNYFYNDYFETYFNESKSKFIKKAKNLNEILNDCNVDIKKFIENSSGLTLNTNCRSIFYFSFNPLSSYEFNSGNLIVSTIGIDIDVLYLLNFAFHNYSHLLFSEFAYDDEFSKIYTSIQNKNLLKDSTYYSNNYSFNDWCVENLIEGFSKFLYYNYCKNIYEYNVYEYDLDFYNYLKSINFTPKKISLKNASINFLKLKINNK